MSTRKDSVVTASLLFAHEEEATLSHTFGSAWDDDVRAVRFAWL
ncbi:MAG: hypothetical protein ACXV0U_10065 [Kineosporiaceae bacterium]